MIATTRKRKAVAALIILELLEGDKQRNWKKRETWQQMKKREEQGYFDNIVRESSVEDTAGYKEMMRLYMKNFRNTATYREGHYSKTEIGGTKLIAPRQE